MLHHVMAAMGGTSSGPHGCGRRQMPWQVHTVVKQPQDIHIRANSTEHHKVSPSAPLLSDMQCPNSWLDVFARSGAQNIRPIPQRLDCERNRFCVGAGLPLTESLGCPLQDVNEVLFSLLTEPNGPNLFHAPAMALDANDAK